MRTRNFVHRVVQKLLLLDKEKLIPLLGLLKKIQLMKVKTIIIKNLLLKENNLVLEQAEVLAFVGEKRKAF